MTEQKKFADGFQVSVSNMIDTIAISEVTHVKDGRFVHKSYDFRELAGWLKEQISAAEAAGADGVSIQMSSLRTILGWFEVVQKNDDEAQS